MKILCKQKVLKRTYDKNVSKRTAISQPVRDKTNILGFEYLLCSSTIIKYIFNSFLFSLFSNRSLSKKLLNTYLIEVHERDN